MRELLSECNPELVKEWSEKNEYSPDKYTAGSSKKVWWKGDCGHEWSERNEPLMPDMVMCKSNKTVWWKGKCGHEWKAKIADRFEGSDCPYCAGIILEGFNDLTTTRPALIDEWSEKNTIKPTEISERSRKVVWWVCRDCGYEWRARVYTRCNGGGECPDCRREISRQLYLDMLERRRKDREDRKALMKRTMVQFLEQAGISYIKDYDPDIGIPISLYIPDKKIAVEFSALRDNRTKEYVKNKICRKKGFTMIRILEPGVNRYDNCFCIKWSDRSQKALKHVIGKLSYIMGIETI